MNLVVVGSVKKKREGVGNNFKNVACRDIESWSWLTCRSRRRRLGRRGYGSGCCGSRRSGWNFDFCNNKKLPYSGVKVAARLEPRYLYKSIDEEKNMYSILPAPPLNSLENSRYM